MPLLGSLNLDMLKLPVGPLGDLPHPVGGFCDKGDVFAIALPSRMLSLYNFKELAIDENAPFSGQPFDSLSVPAAQWLTAPTVRLRCTAVSLGGVCCCSGAIGRVTHLLSCTAPVSYVDRCPTHTPPCSSFRAR